MRGVYARDWSTVNVLGLILALLVDDLIGPCIGRRSPVRKVTVFRGEREWWRLIRKRYQAWYPDPDEALLEAWEICQEIERGHLRWLEPEA